MAAADAKHMLGPMKKKRPYLKRGTALLNDVHLAFDVVERVRGNQIRDLTRRVEQLESAARSTVAIPHRVRHLKAV